MKEFWKDKYVFHVHTSRCGHASEETEEEYVLEAIRQGAKTIVFTDHVPFPGDDIPYRMRMDEMDDYVDALEFLRAKYKDKIDVMIGWEVEYLPSFHGYIKQLREDDRFDLLILGQHLYELAPGDYDLNHPEEELPPDYIGRMEASIAGTATGLFDIIAHPDRSFQFETVWTKDMERLSKQLIEVAEKTDTILEKNLESMRRENSYWEEFWNMVPDSIRTVTGCDAHSVDTLRLVE